MSSHKPSLLSACHLLSWLLVTLLPQPAAGSMVTFEAQQAFLAAAWPGHVVLHVPPAELGGSDQPAGHMHTVRGFIIRQGKAVFLVAPTLGVGEARDLTVTFADGQSCRTRLDKASVDKEAPLTRVPMCKSPPDTGWSALDWADSPELGAGRRAWLIEQPNTVQPGAPPPPPVAIRTFFGKRGLVPMDAYWRVSVKRAVGAPLLDEGGRVLCVVFRYPAGPAGHGLCVPRDGSFVRLNP